MATGDFRPALVLIGSLHIRGAGCLIAMVNGCSSTAAGGSGLREDGIAGIRCHGGRTRRRDSALLFLPWIDKSWAERRARAGRVALAVLAGLLVQLADSPEIEEEVAGAS